MMDGKRTMFRGALQLHGGFYKAGAERALEQVCGRSRKLLADAVLQNHISKGDTLFLFELL
ncbi:MAG: hypothetical protein E7390_04660 [Ruminococcaceae bacterium]|nr:hypothetical protein [Oscillospiraceae bacterium]